MSVQNLNQFGQTPLKGSLDLSYNYNTKSAKLYADSTETGFVAGEPVALVASATGGLPVVDFGNTTTEHYGLVIGSARKNSFVKGDVVEIACEGDVIYVESSAAVNRGAKVQVSSTGTAATVTSGQRYEGIALDYASGSGILIRIEVRTGVAA